MRTVKIICKCGELVEVVDRKIVEHSANGSRCDRSGERYVSLRAGGPSFPQEIVHEGRRGHLIDTAEIPCPCENHSIGEMAAYLVEPKRAPAAPREYPEFRGPVAGGVN